MEALRKKRPRIEFEIFTRVPEWFFEDSLTGPFNYHPLVTDVGLVQETALREDAARTLERLDQFLPFEPILVERLAREVRQLECRCVICDIAPLGIAVAHQAGIPSVLVENFTWDWIYEGYIAEDPAFQKHISYLRQVFEQADYHVQTEPVCAYRHATLIANPVSRTPRKPVNTIREELGIPARVHAVLITMGGIPARHAFLDQLSQAQDLYFVVPGAVDVAEKNDNVILLPHRSAFYHPDLLNACDAVVGKSGYSTVAEAYHAGIPFGYIARERFRESGPLARFIEGKMKGLEISQAQFQDAGWLRVLPVLLAMPRITRYDPNGAGQVAAFISRLLE